MQNLVEEFGLSLAETGRQLGVSSSAVAKALDRRHIETSSPIYQGRPKVSGILLVVPSEDLGSVVGEIQEQYNGISGLDDRVHLHAVRPSVIPEFLTRVSV